MPYAVSRKSSLAKKFLNLSSIWKTLPCIVLFLYLYRAWKPYKYESKENNGLTLQLRNYILPMLWPCAKTAYHNVLKYLSKHSFDLLIYQQVVKIYRSNSQDTSIYIEYWMKLNRWKPQNIGLLALQLLVHKVS